MFLSIQYLRGLAAISVLYFHIYLTNGSQGVAVFFVISGFLMMDILHKKKRTFSEFLKARFLRVAPLYYLLTIVTLLLGVGYKTSFTRAITSFLFVSLGPILDVGWTLTYEFIFYALVSTSILFFKKNEIRITYVVFLLLLGDVFANYMFDIFKYDFGNYFWFFLAGIFSYEIYKLFKKKEIVINPLVLFTIFTLSIIYLFLGKDLNFYQESVNNYLKNYLVSSFLIVTSVVLYESKIKLPNNKILFYLGNASYSLYLTHLIVIRLLSKSLNITQLETFVVCVIIGALCYSFVEKPLTRITKKI
jgi:exopolysaccharide production protein ExoZ